MSFTKYKPTLFSNKVIDFSREEKAKLATLLGILADLLIKEWHPDLSEKETEAMLDTTDHLQFRLLGQRNSENLPK